MLRAHAFVVALASSAILLPACNLPPRLPPEAPPGAECLSLAGEALYPPLLEPDVLARREAELATARSAREAAPQDPVARIWLGRRLSHLYRYREALVVFDEGCADFPNDPRLWRHYGHRQITLRRLAQAEASLQRASELIELMPDEVEPALEPKAHGVDIDWLYHSIWYHLALAHFLQAEWPAAELCWRRCLAVSKNDDARCAAANWLYATLRRESKDAEAKAMLEGFSRQMNVVEYHSYHRLLLLFRGEEDAETLLSDARDMGGVDFATLAFGIANWHLVEGRPERAEELWREIVVDPMWPAFGHIAAEADLSRLRR